MGKTPNPDMPIMALDEDKLMLVDCMALKWALEACCPEVVDLIEVQKHWANLPGVD